MSPEPPQTGERRLLRLHSRDETGPGRDVHLGARGRQVPPSERPRKEDAEGTRRQRSGRLPIRRRSREIRRLSLEYERHDVQHRGDLQPRGQCVRGAARPGTVFLPATRAQLYPRTARRFGIRRWTGVVRKFATVPREEVLTRRVAWGQSLVPRRRRKTRA